MLCLLFSTHFYFTSLKVATCTKMSKNEKDIEKINVKVKLLENFCPRLFNPENPLYNNNTLCLHTQVFPLPTESRTTKMFTSLYTAWLYILLCKISILAFLTYSLHSPHSHWKCRNVTNITNQPSIITSQSCSPQKGQKY